MNENIRLWQNLTFKTNSYRKNYDLVTENENIITEYDGNVSLLRILEKKVPLIIGEYGFSVWNIQLGKLLGVNFDEIIKLYSLEMTYHELLKCIKNHQINISDYSRIVLIHSFILRPDFRKKNVTEEFVEMIYRDFYTPNTLILALVMPTQNNLIDQEYYFKHKFVEIKEGVRDEIRQIPAHEYYKLEEILKKDDDELNKYKLFSVAQRCGFEMVGESYLFKFNPEKTIERIIEKYTEINYHA